MRYFVNDSCIGCGMCAGTCPEIFSMTDEGVAKAKDGDVPAELEDSALRACEECPVGAIEEV